MEKKFFEVIEKNNMIKNNDNIVIALSGGADSVTLTTLLSKYITLNELCVNVTAVHINHSLRAESDSDESFCKEYTKSLGFNFLSKKVDLYEYKNEFKVTIEEAGRNIRYNTFRNVYENSKIFLGHNKNDNVETFILNLSRGSGTKGLIGMSFIAKDLYRPLLPFTKEEIYSYLHENNISYVEDSSNKENIYSRNIVRNEIMPLLKNLNCMSIDNIINTQHILQEEDDYLKELSEDFFKKIKISNTSIDLKKFNSLNIVIKKRIARKILLENFSLKDITSKHITAIINLSFKNEGTKKLNLPNNIIVSSYNNILYFNNSLKDNTTQPFFYKIDFEKLCFIKELNQYIYITKEINELDLNKIVRNENNLKLTIVKNKKFLYNGNYTVILRSRLPGDKIFLSSIQGNKKIKKYFIDEKTPILERDKTPLLAIENTNEILWILDKKNFVNGNYFTTDNSKKINILILEEK